MGQLSSYTNIFTDNTLAKADEVNENFTDIKTVHNATDTASLYKDGSKAMTGALPMGSNKVTGLADGTADTDAVTKGQMDTADDLNVKLDGSNNPTTIIQYATDLTASVTDDKDIPTKKYVDDVVAVVETYPNVPYSVNSGATTSGLPSIFSKTDDSTVAGAFTTVNAQVCHPDGSTEQITADQSITSIVDGTTILLKDKGTTAIQKLRVVVESIVPTMTSDTVPSGYTISAEAGATPYLAFDNNPASAWSSNPTITDAWIQVQLNVGKIVTKYSILGNTGGQSPDSCELKGSNNGSDWDTLDSQISLSWGTAETKTFEFSNTTSYTYYRLVGHTLGGNVVVVYQLDLFETVNTIYEQSTEPSSHVSGDRWLDTSVKPNIPYESNGTTWDIQQFVKMGEVVKTGGTMGTPVTYAFNDLTILEIATTSTVLKTIVNPFNTEKISVEIKEDGVVKFIEPTIDKDEISWTPSYTGNTVLTIKRSI